MCRRALIFRVVLCFAVVSSACVDAGLGPDASSSTVVFEGRDASVSEAGTSILWEAGAARDAEDPPGSGLPRDLLDVLIGRATAALVASVSAVEREAVEDQVTVGADRFRLFSDRVSLSVSRSIGAARLGELTLVVGPNRCEGYDADGRPTGATISECRQPDFSRPFVVGATVLAFARGDSGQFLLQALPVDRTGLVDFGDKPAPSGELDIDSVWALIESRWPR